MLTPVVNTLTGGACKFPDMSPEILAKRAASARMRAGFATEKEAAAAIGCSRTLVIAWETGKSTVKGSKYHLAAAKAYRVTPEWLADSRATDDGFTVEPPPVSDVSVNETAFTYSPMARTTRVPIRGSVNVGANGFWVDTEDLKGAWLDLPSIYADAYAVRIKGDGLDPVIQSGKLVLIEPSATLQPGENVIVKLRDGRSTIAELLRFGSGEYTLQMLADRSRLTVADRDIEFILYAGTTFGPSKMQIDVDR
jgi:phage repressor protein C with HTH and peptisase S24 domain